MKRFYDLTKEQQNKAIEFATKTLAEAHSLGILEFNRELTKSEFHALAVDAAEESLYDNEGNAIDEGMDVPYEFEGGCV